MLVLKSSKPKYGALFGKTNLHFGRAQLAARQRWAFQFALGLHSGPVSMKDVLRDPNPTFCHFISQIKRRETWFRAGGPDAARALLPQLIPMEQHFFESSILLMEVNEDN